MTSPRVDVVADPGADPDRAGEADLVDAVVELRRRASRARTPGCRGAGSATGSGSRGRWCRRTGPAAARSTSTWIHWWSPVASANAFDPALVDLQPVAGAELLAAEAGAARRGRRRRASTGSVVAVVRRARGCTAARPAHAPNLSSEPRPDPPGAQGAAARPPRRRPAPGRRSSSWPTQVGHALPATDADALGRLVRRVGRLRVAGALPGDLRPHRRRSCRPPEALDRVARECADDLAADGVVYAEVRFAPEQHLAGGLDPRRGRRGGAGRASRPGMAGGRRPDRRAPAAHRDAARGPLARDRRAGRAPSATRGVVGFDIAGAEAGFPPTRHLDAFEYLQRENFHFTIHAGEAFGLPSIWEAIQWCGADRLGHGVRIVDDITVDDDGVADARPARRVRPRQADPARAVPGLQRADRRRGLDRRAPDRAADRGCASGSPSTPTTG